MPVPSLFRHQILVEMISDLKQIEVKSPSVLQTPLLLPWHGLDSGSEAFETGLRKAEVEAYYFLFSCSFCTHIVMPTLCYMSSYGIGSDIISVFMFFVLPKPNMGPGHVRCFQPFTE